QCSLHSELSHRGIRGAVGGHIPLTSTFRKGNEATKASGVRRATTAGCDIFTEHRLLSKKFYLCDYSRQPISELSEDRRQTWRGTSIFKRGDFLVPSKFFLLVPTRKKRQRQAHQ
uniref:Ovule protein n=1 Tax=Parascaris univalens TaxID=6257 RepID=A0A915AWX8_PARUN